MLGITFSVLLALVLNEWREDARERKSARLALAAVGSELVANHNSLAERLPYYREMAATLLELEQAQPPDAQGLPREIPGWRGLMPPLFQTAAYDASIATGAFASLDFQTARAVSQAYSIQQIFRDLTQSYAEALIGGGIDDLGRLRGVFSDFSTVGSEVLCAQDQVVDAVRVANPSWWQSDEASEGFDASGSHCPPSQL